MIAIIPARSGSKRILNKNIKMLKGHPLLAYTIKACRLSKNIDRIIVSTNSEEIAEIAKSYGAEVPFIRPEKFSKDTSSDLGFLTHFFEKIKAKEVALMRPTSPLRDPEVIDSVIDLYEIYEKSKKQFTGLRTATFSNHSPYKMYQMEDDRILKGFFKDFNGIKDYTNLPGQTFPKTYIPNGYIDIVKRDTILKNSVFGDRILGVETSQITDIDIEDDFYLAELQVGTKIDKINLNKGDKIG